MVNSHEQPLERVWGEATIMAGRSSKTTRRQDEGEEEEEEEEEE